MTSKRNGRNGLAAIAIAGGMLCVTTPARADLSWEHTGTVRISTVKQPIFKLKMYNSWSAGSRRVLVKYAVAGMAGDMMQMMSPKTIQTFAPLSSLMPQGAGGIDFSRILLAQVAERQASKAELKLPTLDKISNFGALAFVQRASDDRLVMYDSQTKRFIDEPGRALLSRLRFDPWRKLAPELSRQAPPTFTPEQRERLQAEARALFAPIQNRMQKVYFRSLAGTRMFDGIEGRGYRLTQLNNMGGKKRGQQQWLRTAIEWWVSGPLPGDDVVRQFREASSTQLQGLETPTTSMWINEYIKIARGGGDQTMRRAMRTFAPNAGDATGTLGATPLQMSISVVMPPLQRAAVGDIRFDLALTQRSTDTLASSVFTAPSTYTRWEPEPYLKKLDPYLNGSALKSGYDMLLKEM